MKTTEDQSDEISERDLMSAPVATVITEALILEFLAAKTAEYAPQFPEVRELRAYAALTSMTVSLYGYADEAYTSISGHGTTFAEAAKNLREKIGDPIAQAAKLRADAAAMLAKANALAPSAPAEQPHGTLICDLGGVKVTELPVIVSNEAGAEQGRCTIGEFIRDNPGLNADADEIFHDITQDGEWVYDNGAGGVFALRADLSVKAA